MKRLEEARGWVMKHTGQPIPTNYGIRLEWKENIEVLKSQCRVSIHRWEANIAELEEEPHGPHNRYAPLCVRCENAHAIQRYKETILRAEDVIRQLRELRTNLGTVSHDDKLMRFNEYVFVSSIFQKDDTPKSMTEAPRTPNHRLPDLYHKNLKRSCLRNKNQLQKMILSEHELKKLVLADQMPRPGDVSLLHNTIILANPTTEDIRLNGTFEKAEMKLQKRMEIRQARLARREEQNQPQPTFAGMSQEKAADLQKGRHIKRSQISASRAAELEAINKRWNDSFANNIVDSQSTEHIKAEQRMAQRAAAAKQAQQIEVDQKKAKKAAELKQAQRTENERRRAKELADFRKAQQLELERKRAQGDADLRYAQLYQAEQMKAKELAREKQAQHRDSERQQARTTAKLQKSRRPEAQRQRPNNPAESRVARSVNVDQGHSRASYYKPVSAPPETDMRRVQEFAAQKQDERLASRQRRYSQVRTERENRVNLEHFSGESTAVPLRTKLGSLSLFRDFTGRRTRPDANGA